MSNRIFKLSASLYRCQRDSDFPQVTLLSYPFTEMLTEAVEEKKIEDELRLVLSLLKQTGSEIVAIACNTLHAFLPDEAEDSLLHMPKLTAEAVGEREALVLCTSTSRRRGVHKDFFPCLYPEKSVQERIDKLIDSVLGGECLNRCGDELLSIALSLRTRGESPLVLGCTELSLLREKLPAVEWEIIDPLEVVAQKIVIKSFNNKENKYE